jgi:hypothetical protein
MLFALLEEHDPRIEADLRALSVSASDIHAELKRALGTGDGRTWEGILVTPRVRKIVALAEASAGERDVEPSDLWTAIRSEGSSMAVEVLRRASR